QITARGSAPLTRVSDASGMFTFDSVPVARYDVKVTIAGFKQFTTRISVSAGKTAQLNVALQLDAVTETVAVMAESVAERGRDARGRPPPPPPAAPMPIVGGRLPYEGNPHRDFNTAAYDRIEDNAFRRVADDPLSTFSIDVDTASYANVRRFLNGGSLPPRDA